MKFPVDIAMHAGLCSRQRYYAVVPPLAGQVQGFESDIVNRVR